MKTRLTIALLSLLAFACMAPTCTGAERGAGTGSDYAPKMSVLRCTAEGYPIGVGYAIAGDHIWYCTAKVYDATCECPEVLKEVAEFLSVPGASITPAASAIVCWGEATVNPYPDEFMVERACQDVGVYQPGPEGPQSADNGA